MEKIKDSLIVSASYITLSGTIYHLAFWKSFNLNGLAFITVSNVLMSAVSPIIMASDTFLSALFFGAVILTKIYPTKAENYRPSTFTRRKNITVIVVLIVFILIYIISLFKIPRISLATSFILALFLAIHFNLTHVFVNFFKSLTFGFMLYWSLFYLPLGCVAAAAINSEKIKGNFEYNFVVKANGNRTDTLKLLGNSENNFFFTDMKNEKVFYIKSDTLTIHFKKDTRVFTDRPKQPPRNP